MVWKDKIRRWCSRSERSRKEVIEKIIKEGGTQSQADKFLKTLEKEGFVDQSRFISAFVHDHFHLKRWGPRKIIDGLRNKGCSISDSEGEISKLTSEKVKNMLREVAKSRLSLYPDEDKNNKPKHIRYLQGRGYDLDMILSLV